MKKLMEKSKKITKSDTPSSPQSTQTSCASCSSALALLSTTRTENAEQHKGASDGAANRTPSSAPCPPQRRTTSVRVFSTRTTVHCCSLCSAAASAWTRSEWRCSSAPLRRGATTATPFSVGLRHTSCVPSWRRRSMARTFRRLSVADDPCAVTALDACWLCTVAAESEAPHLKSRRACPATVAPAIPSWRCVSQCADARRIIVPILYLEYDMCVCIKM